MSYMESKEKNPKFSEVIISFWFRMPGESFAAIDYKNEQPYPVLNGILPLLVMGEEGIEIGKYNTNPSATLYFTSDFQCDGVFMDTTAETISNECTSHWIWDWLGYHYDCCLTWVSKTMYTATPSTDFTCTPSHHELYDVIYDPEYVEQKANPTCIGVDQDGYLYVNFQTNTQPAIGGDEPWKFVTSITPGEDYMTSGNMGYMEGLQTITTTYFQNILGCVGLWDTSTTEGPTIVPGISSTGHSKPAEKHETTFPILPYETGKFTSGGYEDSSFGNNIKVSPDRWHHVLVSAKLRTTGAHSENFVAGDSPMGFEGGSLLYVALDDKNYIKDDLNGMWSWGSKDGKTSKIGDNEVYPWMAWDYATDYWNPDRYAQETYKLSSPEVPAGTIGLPATGKYVDNIKRVEMAELQIWFGKSFDTKEESNRRLFIDSEGKPVKIETKIAEDALGKPDVLLHGSNKWKNGINTGKLAPAAGSGPPDPWFKPTPEKDGIVRWKPDPSLHGPQNPGEKPAAPQGGT
jgi:hypothetical protein